MAVSSSSALPPGASKWEVAEDGDPDSQRLAAPVRLPRGAGPWPVHPPSEEGGRLERQGVTPHPCATEPGAPVRFTFHSVPNRGFEPRTSWFWARRLYLSWASSACERLTGFEPATSTGEVALLPAELQPHGALPRCRPGRHAHTKGERTPIRRASVPGAGLEPARACFKGRQGCRQPTPERTGAPARCHPWLAGLTRAARSLEPEASTLGGTRTRNHMALNHARLPVCGTSAREPPPGADPGHPPYEGGAAAVRGGLAATQGFEP
jgi:hypothetical protein